jgi:hypothetical protein
MWNNGNIEPRIYLQSAFDISGSGDEGFRTFWPSEARP